MNRSFRIGICFLATSWVLAAGCGDDDDDGDGAGGSGGSGASSGSGGSTPNGGSSAEGGNDAAGGDAVGGDGAGGATASAECEVLGHLCHEVDDTAGPLHECHELGHVGDATVCRERFGECVNLCLDAGGGEGGAGGAGGAPGGGAGGTPGEGGAGGAGPTQSPYCRALGELCHAVDDVDGPLNECHQIGHIGVAADCEARFDDCATQCLAAAEALEPQ